MRRANKIAKHEYGFCLVNFLDEYVFVIGGGSYGPFKTVSRYEITDDIWEEMPELNETRVYSSACSLGGNIYVFCGCNDEEGYANSIEKLNNPGLTRNEASWKLIQPPNSILSPRSNPVVVTLNANQIAILGGYCREDGDQSDVILFDITAESCKKAISNCPFEFYSRGNQTA